MRRNRWHRTKRRKLMTRMQTLSLLILPSVGREIMMRKQDIRRS